MKVAAGSGMQVTVAVGEAWINGTSNSVQGGYLGRVTSSTALAISASSESNNRVDTIIAQVQDKAVAGGTDSFSVSVVTGTAESGVTKENKKGAGAIPASSLVLGYVFVENKAVSIVGGDIENVAAAGASGLHLPTASLTGTIAAAQLAAGSVTEPKLAGEAVTEVKLAAKSVSDAKVATNRTLVNTSSLPSAKGAVSLNTVYTPSATRLSLVTVSVGVNAHSSVVLYINGAEYAEVYDAEGGVPITVPVLLAVPPGVTWEAKCPLGSVSSLNASTLIL
jgi:hypothetical protein